MTSLLRAIAALITVLPFLLATVTRSATAQTAPAGGGDVVANLWEWNWPSVGRECTTVLGPDGYGAVLVAPPQDSPSLTDTTPAHPWWEVYQVVDYTLTSRMGNEAQFKAMVAACRAAGVKVYVDAVINHMTGQGSVSYGGVHYTHFSYPGLYTDADFHHYPADCPIVGQIADFNDYTQVTECELDGLADLRTESGHVRDTIAGYLNALLADGVSGFRIDSAKHIAQPDLAAIEAMLHATVDGNPPYVALEVFPGSTDPRLLPSAFEPLGNLLGFDFADALHAAFQSTIAGLRSIDSGLLPSDKELVFVENHDTERDGSTLNYKSGKANILATEFMLAWPHGRPAVFASFTWSDPNGSPPADANGAIADTDCSHGWSCTDRNRGVAHMVAWHNDVAGTPVAHWYDDRQDLIAFSRGKAGWIAINDEGRPRTRTFTTGLPKGTYCDLIHGTYTAGTCSGKTVKVDARGRARITVPKEDAVAIDAGDKVRVAG